jgi:polysaccharide biosynthesis/export protein
MRSIVISLLALSLASAASSQTPPPSTSADSGAATFANTPNLSIAKLGQDDLIGVSVYDSPELTRTVRVDAEGFIRLPMVRQRIQAAGRLPAELETAIANALIDEHVMVNPVVTVSVVEYHSRPITVIGAVKNPITFQATGNVMLLDAISRAGGLTSNAGAEILVSHTTLRGSGGTNVLTERVSVHSLLDIADPASNLKLEGGENIRVPEAGQVFVVGNVKRPGAFLITNGPESSVLKALSLSGGLDSFASHQAYIYRTDDVSGHKNEIPIDLKGILKRKSPDVPMFANDMLYIPNAAALSATVKTLQVASAMGIGIATLVLYTTR